MPIRNLSNVTEETIHQKIEIILEQDDHKIVRDIVVRTKRIIKEGTTTLTVDVYGFRPPQNQYDALKEAYEGLFV